MSEQNRGVRVTPASAGLAGLVVGMVAGATLTVLSNPNTRRRAKQQIDDMSTQAKKAYQKTTQQAQEVWQQIEPEINQTGRQIKDQLSRAGQSEMAGAKGGQVAREVGDSVASQAPIEDLMSH